MVHFEPMSRRRRRMMRTFVECPACHHSLMDNKHPISGVPSIALTGVLAEPGVHREAVIRLSSYWGDFVYETTLQVPEGAVTIFHCPHCRALLNTGRVCDECNAPMVELDLERGSWFEYCLKQFARRRAPEISPENYAGKLQFCARRGCRRHHIHFANPSANLKEFYLAYSVFLE